jgi:hypothetical protein
MPDRDDDRSGISPGSPAEFSLLQWRMKEIERRAEADLKSCRDQNERDCRAIREQYDREIKAIREHYDKELREIGDSSEKRFQRIETYMLAPLGVLVTLFLGSLVTLLFKGAPMP